MLVLIYSKFHSKVCYYGAPVQVNAVYLHGLLNFLWVKLTFHVVSEISWSQPNFLYGQLDEVFIWATNALHARLARNENVDKSRPLVPYSHSGA